MRTLMLVYAVPGDDVGGMKFVGHASRFKQYMRIAMADLRAMLLENTVDSDAGASIGCCRSTSCGFHY